MEKEIARCRQKRKGKKISITKRINQMRNMIAENGSRTRLVYLRGELKRIFSEAIAAHEDLLNMLHAEDEDFEDTWIEDLGLEVDNCWAAIEEYLQSREGEEPSICGTDERLSSADLLEFRRLPDVSHPVGERGIGARSLPDGPSTSHPPEGMSNYRLENYLYRDPTSSISYRNPYTMEQIPSVVDNVWRPEMAENLFDVNPVRSHVASQGKQIMFANPTYGLLSNSQHYSSYGLNPYIEGSTEFSVMGTESHSAGQLFQGTQQGNPFQRNSDALSRPYPFTTTSTDLPCYSRSMSPSTQILTLVNSGKTPHMTTHIKLPPPASIAPPARKNDGHYDVCRQNEGGVRYQHDSSYSDIILDLQRLQLPTFDGDKYKYEEWKDIFETCIDSRPGNEKWKMLRLKSCLSGEAKDIIRGLDNSPIAYKTALDRLELEYGGTKRILARHLNDIKEARQIPPGSHRELRKFVTLLDAVIISLRNNGRLEELGDGMLHHVAKEKIPKSLLLQFKRWIAEKHKEDNLLNLRDWLLEEVRILIETQEDIDGFKSKKKDSFTHHGSKKEETCSVCSGHHKAESCFQLKALDITKRFERVRDLKLCYRCLEKGHRSRGCKSSIGCTVEGCKDKHHTLLHKPKAESKGTDNTTAATCVGGKTSLRTIPVIISNGDRSMKIMAVLDDCSTSTYVAEDVATALQLEGIFSEMEVSVIGSKKHIFKSMQVEFQIYSIDGQYASHAQANTLKEVTGKIHAVNWRKDREKWRHLNDLPFPTLPKNTKVKLLIGLDLADAHQSLKEVKGRPKEPIARLTPLGWTCVGSMSDGNATFTIKGAHAYLVHRESETFQNLDDQLKRFWDLEALGLLPQKGNLVLTPDEKHALNTVKETRVKEIDRYEVGIPWKLGEPDMRSNYPLARSRLHSLEASLQRKPGIRDEYRNIIGDYCLKGYIQAIPNHQREEQEWFLPHFPVIREDKATSKVRVVFDAAAKSDGKSLNDAIHTGPKLLQDLLGVLIRFRSRKFALVGDIAEMFLQIGLRKNDRKYHRFLWKKIAGGDIQVFEFNRLIFGNKASPFLAQEILQYHAKTNMELYPLAAEAILRATYMDDVSESKDTVKEVIELRRQLSLLLSSAGFHIRKWCSNSSEVLDEIPEEDRARNVHLEDGVLPKIKTLGIIWETQEDSFAFETDESKVTMTKRGVLQKVATIFDPLQLLAPFIVRAKVMLQHAWTLGLSWDEELTSKIKEEWEQWFKELKDIAGLRVPRYLGFRNNGSSTLHTYVDASALAYAAVTYNRTEDQYGNVDVVMVAAKTRVAPLKTISIPRLELLAAVLGIRLAESIKNSNGILAEESIFWSDSQNVLFWIHGQSKQYKPFVAHRVGEIHELSSPQQWRYIPTNLNPADVATRGLKASDKDEWQAWFCGPNFLQDPPKSWPKSKIEEKTEAANMEFKKEHRALMTVSPVENWIRPDDFSSWKRLKRLTAWCFRFIFNARMKCRTRSNSLTTAELKNAETHWIKKAQEDTYSEEIRLLRQHKQVPKSSKLIKLQPTIDELGQLRVNGRLKLSTRLPRDVREPIILPRKHRITWLIIYHKHELLHHKGGINHLLSELSQTFWIVRAREAIKGVCYNCTRCLKNNATAKPQIMAPLPEIRTNIPFRAFSHVGLDYAGPFLTRQGRGKAQTKRYLCLFTCFASRAVHLEMAWSLDTDSFLEALSRMVARRGKPKEIMSDNGTNLTSAESELQTLLKDLDQEKITYKATELGIVWKFNPPGAPHFGGIFESMVKTAKRAITAILSNAMVKDEELLTAFTIAEGLVNSRPLTYQSSDPKDELPLTPNHFLFGQADAEVAPDVDFSNYNPNRRWYYVQQLISRIWKRWMKEILPTLNPRHKWNTLRDDLEVGDIVICIDTNTPRGNWPMGRVLETNAGKDGHIRVVKLKIGEKTFIRPLSKIIRIQKSTTDHCET